jgi:serine/threonine protein kinase
MGLEALHSRIRHQSLDAASCGTSHSAQGHAMREARLAAVWCGGPGGRLRIGGGTSMELAALPLLGRRYRALRLLGEGTFAQILECEDTLAPLRHQTSSYTADYGRHFSDAHGSSSIGIGSGRRRVAVKVLRAGFAELGRREARALAAVQFSRNVSTSLNGSSGSSCSAGPENELWSMGGSSAATGLPVLGLRGTFHFLGHFAVVLDLAAGSLLDVAFGGYPLGGHTRTPWRVVDPRAGIFPPPPPPTNDSVSRNAPENTQNSNYGADDCRQSTHGAMSSSSGDNNGNGEDSAESSFTAREQWDARVQARKSSRVLPPQVPHTPAHVVLAIAAHLLTALARLKALGIVHADLKVREGLSIYTSLTSALLCRPCLHCLQRRTKHSQEKLINSIFAYRTV